MRIGVAPHRLWPRSDGETDDVAEPARTAEEPCFGHIIASGHLPAGDAGVPPHPLVLLSAAAGATRRIRLVAGVLVLPRYDPVVLAHGPAPWTGSPEAASSSARHRLGPGAVRGGRRPLQRTGPPRRRTARVRTAVVAGRGPREAARRTAALPGRPARADRRPQRRGPAPHPPSRDAWHGAGNRRRATRGDTRPVDASGCGNGRARYRRDRAGAIAPARGTGTEPGRAGRTGRDPAAIPPTAGAFLPPRGLSRAVDLPGRPQGGTRANAQSARDEPGRPAEAGLPAVSRWPPKFRVPGAVHAMV